MKITLRQSGAHLQGGATLIEALVAILVLSLGLLGIAGMQLNALAFQKSSWATHRIAELSGDIGERMRANPSGALKNNYGYATTYSIAKSATLTSNGCRPAPPAAAPACSAAQIAIDDMSAWLVKAQKSLPSGAATLEGSSTTGYIATAMYLDKEFVDPTSGAAMSSTTCTSAMTSIDWRNCCPSAAAVPNGVRCSRTLILP